jgi:hypothetical protein
MVHRHPRKTQEEVSARAGWMGIHIGRALLACLAVPAYASALNAQPPETGDPVACPASWAVSGRIVALTQTRFWFGPDLPFGPDDREVPPRYAATVLLDCTYGPARDPDARLTLQVPGSAQSCGEPRGPHRQACRTLDTAGADRPRTHVAERVGPKTSLEGFGLNQDAAGLAHRASASGFQCVQTERLTCTRDHTRVEVSFVEGRSLRVVSTQAGSPETIAAARTAALFRFGLKRSFTGADAGIEFWEDRRSGVKVQMPRQDGAFSLVLQGRAAR